jgi:hypothetical protein
VGFSLPRGAVKSWPSGLSLGLVLCHACRPRCSLLLQRGSGQVRPRQPCCSQQQSLHRWPLARRPHVPPQPVHQGATDAPFHVYWPCALHPFPPFPPFERPSKGSTATTAKTLYREHREHRMQHSHAHSTFLDHTSCPHIMPLKSIHKLACRPTPPSNISMWLQAVTRRVAHYKFSPCLRYWHQLSC